MGNCQVCVCARAFSSGAWHRVLALALWCEPCKAWSWSRLGGTCWRVVSRRLDAGRAMTFDLYNHAVCVACPHPLYHAGWASAQGRPSTRSQATRHPNFMLQWINHSAIPYSPPSPDTPSPQHHPHHPHTQNQDDPCIQYATTNATKARSLMDARRRRCAAIRCSQPVAHAHMSLVCDTPPPPPHMPPSDLCPLHAALAPRT